MIELVTDRLVLRELCDQDAEFIVELVNDPDWLHYIGDRDVRNVADASRYIRTGPRRMYEQDGMGLLAVTMKASGVAIGVCGLLTRPSRAQVDLGFAFLRSFRGQGYAAEAARTVLRWGKQRHALASVDALVLEHNAPSIKLLKHLGFSFQAIIDSDGEAIALYVLT